MIPFSFWFLLAMCIAAVAVGIIAMKKFPDIPNQEGSDLSELRDQEKYWSKKKKELGGWT